MKMLRLTLAAVACTAALAMLPTSAGAAVTSSPPTLNFASQQVGSTSASQAVTISATCDTYVGFPVNTCFIPGLFSTGPVFSGANPGDFSQTNTCGVGISSSSPSTPTTCQFQVSFQPTAAGARAATLRLGATGFPVPTTPRTVELTGTATAPPVVTPPPTPPSKARKCKKKGKKAGAAKKCKKKK